MNADEFAARCIKRLDPAPDPNDVIADWKVFTAMLKANADAVPLAGRFDDGWLVYAEEGLARIEAWLPTIPPETMGKYASHPVDVTLKRSREDVERVRIMRLMWRAFTDLFAAEAVEDEEAQKNALVALVVLSEKHPDIYWRFDLHFHAGVAREAEAASTKEYRKYDEYFRPPETWVINGGKGFDPAKSIFPPWGLRDPGPVEHIYGELIASM